MTDSMKFSPTTTRTSPSRVVVAVVPKIRGGTCSANCKPGVGPSPGPLAIVTALKPNLDPRVESLEPPLDSATQHLKRTRSSRRPTDRTNHRGSTSSRCRGLRSADDSGTRWRPNTSTPLAFIRATGVAANGVIISTCIASLTVSAIRPELGASIAARARVSSGSGVSECRSLTVTCVRPFADAGTSHPISPAAVRAEAATHTPPNWHPIRASQDSNVEPLSSAIEEDNNRDSPSDTDGRPEYDIVGVARRRTVSCCPSGAPCESCCSMRTPVERDARGSDSHTARAEETKCNGVLRLPR